MLNNASSSFADKEILGDVLSTQKFITGNYNTYANECSCEALKTEFVDLLNEEHQMQHAAFVEMQKRGWYQTEPADQNKISQAKQKYTASR